MSKRLAKIARWLDYHSFDVPKWMNKLIFKDKSICGCYREMVKRQFDFYPEKMWHCGECSSRDKCL